MAFALFVWIGFALHRGAEQVIGPYTPGYLAFLLILAIALIVPIGTLLLLDRVLGERRAIRTLGSLVLLGLLGYGLEEVAHASSRVHSFDPFLQFPGARFGSVPQRAEAGVTRVVTLGGSTTHNGYLAPEDRAAAEDCSLPDVEFSPRSPVRTKKRGVVRMILVTKRSIWRDAMSRAGSARAWFPASSYVTIRSPRVGGISSMSSMAVATAENGGGGPCS